MLANNHAAATIVKRRIQIVQRARRFMGFSIFHIFPKVELSVLMLYFQYSDNYP